MYTIRVVKSYQDEWASRNKLERGCRTSFRMREMEEEWQQNWKETKRERVLVSELLASIFTVAYHRFEHSQVPVTYSTISSL